MVEEAFLDKTGREIKKGQYLVQAQRLGNSARLTIGRVISVDEKGVKVRNADHRDIDGKRVVTLRKATYISCLDRTLITPELVIPDYYVDALKELVP